MGILLHCLRAPKAKGLLEAARVLFIASRPEAEGAAENMRIPQRPVKRLSVAPQHLQPGGTVFRTRRYDVAPYEGGPPKKISQVKTRLNVGYAFMAFQEICLLNSVVRFVYLGGGVAASLIR